MKQKIILGITIFLTLLFLVACDPPNFYHENFLDEVLNIELIEYSETYLQNDKNINEYDFNKEEVLDELEFNTIKDCLFDITELFIVKYRTHPNSVGGKCLKICFDEGVFEVISQNGLVVQYSSDGRVLKYVGIIDDKSKLMVIINNYFGN